MEKKIYNLHSALKASLFLLTFIFCIANSEIKAQAVYCPPSPAVTPGSCASQIGYQTYAKGNYSFAAGYLSTAFGISSVAIGQNAYAGAQSYAIGQNAKANSVQSYAIGRYVEANEFGSFVIGSSTDGYSLINSIPNSLMIGFNSSKPTLFIGQSTSITGTGKVGIATTNPYFPLHVIGSAAISSGSLLLNSTEKLNASFDWGIKAATTAKGSGLVFYKEGDDVKMVLTDAGNLGIGTLNPTALLDVNGNLKSSNLEVTEDATINKTNIKTLILPDIAEGLLTIDKFGGVNSTTISSVMDNLGNHSANQNIALNGHYLSGDGSNNGIFITNNGNVGIGVNNPQTRLAVEGLICSREVRVSLGGQPCWPDYVFESNYTLPDLMEVENYIQTHKHLPDIPSAQQVKEQGIELGEMNALLLKKIEELTLYTIELKKEIDQLKQERSNK